MSSRRRKLVFLALILSTTSYEKECSSRPTLEPSISSLMVHIGSNVKLDCIGGPAASGDRNSFLKWELATKQPFHNNVKTFHLADRHRRNIICDVERLSITNFTKDNKGNYHCARKHNTTLVSINMIDPSPPNIQIKMTQPLKVIKGTTITLQCFVTGSPVPNVKWRHENSTESSSCGNLCHSASCSNFTCPSNVTVSKNSTYWCEAENKYGRTVKNISIEVLEKPSVVKIIDVNHNKFVCTVELVHPPPTFHWRYREYFDCSSEEKCLYQWKTVNASAPDFEISSTTEKSVLKASLVIHKRPLKGFLQCIASNEGGNVNTTFGISLEADGPSNTELNIMSIILISNGILLVLLIVVLIVCVLKKHPNQHRRLISTFNELQVKVKRSNMCNMRSLKKQKKTLTTPDL